jgi:hypothetical protein
MDSILKPHVSPDASVEEFSGGAYKLIIPAGPKGQYRIAQIDDYTGRPRRNYLHNPPIQLRLEARTNRDAIPGTWGFGLWNAPLSLAFGFGGKSYLPALPNATWFFHSSKDNYLSFTDDAPANGFLAQTFRSPKLPIWLFAPMGIFLPFLAIRPIARLLRKLVSRLIIKDNAKEIKGVDVTSWHSYQMNWLPDKIEFCIDDKTVYTTTLVPKGPLGIVIWVDNQHAAFNTEGRLSYGVLENPEPASLEIRNISIL